MCAFARKWYYIELINFTWRFPYFTITFGRMLRFYKFFFLWKVSFSVCHAKISSFLSDNLNIFWGYKSSKNLSILTKFACVFSVNNLSLCTKNCDRMLDTFYGDTSKSWTFVFIYVPLSENVRDNNLKIPLGNHL